MRRLRTCMIIVAIAQGGAIAAQPLEQSRQPVLISAAISDSDYPASSLESGEEGIVTVAFTVSEKGKVLDCKPSVTSGIAALDEISCKIISRFRYKPALDTSGKKVSAEALQSFAWMISSPCPQDDPQRICVSRPDKARAKN